MEENIQRKENFNQVCVWPGTLVGDNVSEFENYLKTDMKTRVQYLEEIETSPDTDNDGHPVENTGGRNDLFFAVHNEDIQRFAIPSKMIGVRWIEDVLARCNYKSKIYPERVFKYKTWETENEEE